MKTKSFTLVILAIFGMVIFTNYTSKNTKETDASSLLFMLEEEKLAHDVYTFLYSKRSGTPAATMLNQVELSDKKKRLQALMAVQNDISLNINKSYEGKVVEVMVEGPSKSDKTRFTGRTRTNKIVIWDKQGDEATGDLINVKITKAQTWVLNGELI